MSNNLLSELKAELAGEKTRIPSGFKKLDEAISGFRPGATYIVGGLKKSGKSSFLMNIVSEMLKSGQKVGFINTELPKTQFFERMSAISDGLLLKEVEEHPTYPIAWLEENAVNFFYGEKKDITDSLGLSIVRTLNLLSTWVMKGANILIIDNLTTYAAQATDSKRGWEILASALDRLIDFAKENKVVLFAVIHIKDQVIFSETPQGIRNLVDKNELEAIFDKSIVVNRRPTSSDLYGGGAAKSQISGGILLIWRPYQDFALTDYQRMALLILEDFRDGTLANQIKMDFDGSRLKFSEVLTPEEIFNG